jgi:hypothetical protein
MTSRLISTFSPNNRRLKRVAWLIPCVSLVWVGALFGQTVHGFLALKTLDRTPLADGDLIQTGSGGRITTRLLFHFKDGSIHDETVVYSQEQRIRLITYRLVQKGPAFPRPLDMSIDGRSGQVTVRYEEDGKQKTEEEHIDVPADLANGLIPTMLRSVQNGASPMTVPFVVPTPKPRLVKLLITAAGDEPFSTGGAARKATHYVVKVEIGGISGMLAPLVGKQPPDSHVWILRGEAPTFVKS